MSIDFEYVFADETFFKMAGDISWNRVALGVLKRESS